MRGDDPSVFRVAQNISLKIELDHNPDRNEQLFVPYLEILYTSFKTEDVKKVDVQIGAAKQVQVNFMSEYSMNTKPFWSFASALFISFMVIMCVIVLLKVYLSQRENRLNVD